MRTIRTKIFNFNELTEDAKNKAIEYFAFHLDSYWYECVYDDAAQIGIKILGFDVYGQSIDIDFYWLHYDVANKIILNHDQETETYQTAKKYLEGRKELDEYEDNSDEYEESLDNLENDLKHEIAEDYLILLRKEYEYITGRESIIENIEVNEYEFYADGTLFK